ISILSLFYCLSDSFNFQGIARDLHSFPTRRSSDLAAAAPLSGARCPSVRSPSARSQEKRGELPLGPPARAVAGPLERALVVDAQIGRAHVLTPVTIRYRMPSFACKKKKTSEIQQF